MVLQGGTRAIKLTRAVKLTGSSSSHGHQAHRAVKLTGRKGHQAHRAQNMPADMLCSSKVHLPHIKPCTKGTRDVSVLALLDLSTM